MYTIRTLNNIAKTGLAKLPEQNFVIDEKAENPEGIILRSFDMHKMELNENLLAVFSRSEIHADYSAVGTESEY